MSETGPTNDGGHPGEGATPRRTRNQMIADAFRNKRLPDDWVDEEPNQEGNGGDEDEHETGFNDEPEPYVPPEPESHRISSTASQSVGCLVGAALLIRVAIQASLPSWALVALWLGVLGLAGGCLYLLNRLVEEHERELTVLLPGVGGVVGAIVLLLFGHGVDPNLGAFFAFTVATAIASMGYAVWHNRKHFGWGNAIAVTVIELVFTPIAIGLSLLYFFRHDVARQVAPGLTSGGSPFAKGGANNIPSIGSVSQSGNTFYVYDDSNSRISQLTMSGVLLGYTSRVF